MKIILARITEHPLQSGRYMLNCPITAIPPFFGSLTECESKLERFETMLQRRFKMLDKKTKDNAIEYAVKHYGYNREELEMI